MKRLSSPESSGAAGGKAGAEQIA